MSEKQSDTNVLRDLNSQVILHDGMISPPPLDDMMFAPSSDFEFHGGNDCNSSLDQRMSDKVEADGAAALADMQSLSNSKLCPTPSSLSQPSLFEFGDQQFPSARESLSSAQDESELSSILDEPKKSSKKSEVAAVHHTAKKQRRESIPNSLNAEDEGQADGKDRSREKNKIAAAKCRAKKRDHMEVIESSHRTLSAEHSLLRRQEQSLRATVAELRTLALDHQICTCGVHDYNMLEARKLAHGLGGLCSIGSGVGNLPAPGEQQRKRSHLGDYAPSNNTSTHNRSHSFTAPGQYGVASAEDFLPMQNLDFSGQQGFFEYDPSLNGRKLEA